MKKQKKPSIKAHLLWSALILLALLAVCAIPFALAQRQAAKQSVPSLNAPAKNDPAQAAPPSSVALEGVFIRASILGAIIARGAAASPFTKSRLFIVFVSYVVS